MQEVKTKKKWSLNKNTIDSPIDGVSSIIRQILSARGIQSEKDVAEFLALKPQETYDPFLLKDMEAATELVIDTIKHNRRICIYGDYDADGITAICLMLEFLSHLSGNVTYYIPSRVDEGYGLNREALDLIKRDGVDLIITVDCGSTSFEEVNYAKDLGMAVIVTDHHTLACQPPDCLIVNPKQAGCAYPFKDLCGCGVAFKMAQALQRKTGVDKVLLNQLLDIVAIATIGDIVPLISENRTLVKHGLEVINQGKREGILRLAEAAGIKSKPLKSYQVAYIIVPHLNAAGRMAEACAGVRLFTAKGHKAIQEAAQTLAANNCERKRIQDEIYRTCLDLVRRQHAEERFIVIDAGDAHEGITGIVAGKIKEVYNRPVIVVTKSGNGDLLKGTGRSIEGVNMYALLKEQEDLFIKFGGHAGACGFLMQAANLELLRDNLNLSLEKQYGGNEDLFYNRIQLDASVTIADLTMAFVNQLDLLEPFGHKNERPLFEIPKASVIAIYFMGEDKQHARFTVSDGQGQLDCILFGEAKDFAVELEKGAMVSLAGYPDINIWREVSKIQFVVKDIKCYINVVD